MPNDKSGMDTILLKRELVGLFGHLQKIRGELAALNPQGKPEHFSSMSEQLDAIVASTENATNTIMESMESIDTLMSEAQGLIGEDRDPRLGEIYGTVSDHINQVFEACSFQDITGQRISKVVNSLKFVEARINSIVKTWGREELSKVATEMQSTAPEEDPDKKLLHGPQLPGQGISQTQVDSMLDQNDIDKLFD